LFGFNIFDPQTETFSRYRIDYYNPTAPTSLSDDNIQALLVPDAHTVWVGTQNGLNRLDRRTGHVEQFYVADGLPSNQIAGLALDDEGFLWVATNKGLCRF